MATPRMLQGEAPASACAGPPTMTVGNAGSDRLLALHGLVRALLVSSHCGYPSCPMHTCPGCCCISVPVSYDSAEAVGMT